MVNFTFRPLYPQQKPLRYSLSRTLGGAQSRSGRFGEDKYLYCAIVLFLNIKGKDEGKFLPRRGHEGPEGEQMYSSTLSLTSALDRVGDQRHTPAALPPVKTRYPLYRRLSGPQGRSGRVRKISSPPPGFDPRTVQPVASRYTD